MSSRNKLKRSGEYSREDDKVTNERLGNLPDPILGRILSLLPMENAVQTSILSRKWRYKWVLISQLCFDDSNVWRSPTKKAKSPKNSFVNFVERALLLVGNSALQKFQLRLCSQDYDPSQITKWIQAAMRHDARTIDICCPSMDLIAFPCLTLCSTTLKELNIKAKCSIKVLEPTNFSSLNILNLNGVTFTDVSATSESSSEEVKRFNLSFNVLKVLKLVNCRWENGDHLPSLKMMAPKLNSLSIRDDNNRVHNGDGRYTSECILLINVPKLANFKTYGYSVPYIILQGRSSVTDITVEVPFSVSDLDTVQDDTVRLLERFFSAKNLKVSSKVIKHDLPKLNNLIQIEVNDGDFDENLMALLRSATALQSLIFGWSFKYNKSADLHEMVPQTVFSHLKTVQIHGSSKDWLELAKYILKNAIVLEKMIIMYGTAYIDPQLMKKLLECPRCSSRASVVFN